MQPIPHVLLAIACTPWLVAQTSQWRLHPVVTPTFVAGAQLAYDDLRDRVVRYGGAAGFQLSAELHELDGDDWIQVVASGPGGRVGHVMAFDSARGETIAFGGSFLGPTFWTDTWRWNGSSWAQAMTATSPPGMFEPAMCFDEARQRMVLFGAGQTFEWDGVNWQQRLPAHTPGARFAHALAYDAQRQRTVLFGGKLGAADQFDTWEWDGLDWVQTLATGPGASSPVMAYDRERGRCVMLGFAPGQVVAAEFDGLAWATIPAPSPTPGELVLAYDRQRGRVVCYSARDANGSPGGFTWSYEHAALAVAQPFGVGCGNPPLSAANDPGARPLLGGTLAVDVANVPTNLAFVAVGWSNRTFAGGPLPAPLAGIGMPGCTLLQSLDLSALPLAMTSTSTARFHASLPTAPQFLGVRFFLQPWAVAPGANPLEIVTGNGIAVTVGSW